MATLVALGLLGLVLYTSTLAYAMRDYWRSELSERLRGRGPRQWLEWLEQHESELQVLTEFVRTLAFLGVLGAAYWWYGLPESADWTVGRLVTPGIVAIVLLFVCGLGVPHALAVHAGEGILSRSVWVLLALRTALWPVARALTALEFVTRRLLGKAESSEIGRNDLMEQEILEVVSEGEAQGAVDEEQKEIIQSVFRLRDTAVSAIMTPRTDIDAVACTVTFDEVRDAIVRTGHSRLPVYEQSVDHIIGVLYAKDLLRLKAGDRFDARRLMRLAPYVPETKSVDDLLDDFRQSKVQIAIVLDEYGGTAGLVTLEDILEELVGEIDDEYDQRAAPTIHRMDADTVEVDARVRVDEINAELGVSLPDEEDFDTIGGFVFSTLGKIPVPGDEFRHENVRFSILAAEPRKINRLRIHVEREAPTTT